MTHTSIRYGENNALDELATRKKEYETFKTIRLNEIMNERGIDQQTYDSTSMISNDGYFSFTESEYSLITFCGLSFGIENAALESDCAKFEDVKLYFCTFTECCFSNIKFTNCIFVGCTFSECFSMNLGMIFENCGQVIY